MGSPMPWIIDTPAEFTQQRAVEAALVSGVRTADLARPGEKSVSTVEMGRAIKERLE